MSQVLKMITQRARQQEIQLSELEAREQAYVEMEENAAQTREINDQLTLKLKRFVVRKAVSDWALVQMSSNDTSHNCLAFL